MASILAHERRVALRKDEQASACARRASRPCEDKQAIEHSRARSDGTSKSRRDESHNAHEQRVPTVVSREYVHHSRCDGSRQEHDVRDEGHHRPDSFGAVNVWLRRRGRAVDLVLDARFRGRVRRVRGWWSTCSNLARRFTRRLSA
eukprot:2922907-Pleurochrysis_carterae.AAC.1